jgi:hypothetical protein
LHGTPLVWQVYNRIVDVLADDSSNGEGPADRRSAGPFPSEWKPIQAGTAVDKGERRRSNVPKDATMESTKEWTMIGSCGEMR